jgi:predicted HTH domain antitoxin
MKRTNIMLDDEQHKMLKTYARKEGRTLGGMVREAIDTVYKKKDALDRRREVALHAYQEGFISLGKLAEVLGLDPVSARAYLRTHGIALLSQDVRDAAQDAENA